MHRFKQFWSRLRSSFWFMPTLMVTASVALAVALVETDSAVSDRWMAQWPRLFGATPEGARQLLATIAGSMMTVMGVTFSMTLVALALASSQYTSRILRNFMRSRVTQSTLGSFAGIFTYCLVVFFPAKLGHELDGDEDHVLEPVVKRTWGAVPAERDGCIQDVDSDALLRLAQDKKTVVRMEQGIGEFVVKSSALVSIALDGPPDEETMTALNASYSVGSYRTVEQDPAFGVRQIVDMALKALSPGVNDTSTAVICVDYLTAILARLAARKFPASRRYDGGELRVMAMGPTFEALLGAAFDQIRRNAAGNVSIMSRMLGALEAIASQTERPRRRLALREQMQRIAELADRTIDSAHDQTLLKARLTRVRTALATGSTSCASEEKKIVE